MKVSWSPVSETAVAIQNSLNSRILRGWVSALIVTTLSLHDGAASCHSQHSEDTRLQTGCQGKAEFLATFEVCLGNFALCDQRFLHFLEWIAVTDTANGSECASAVVACADEHRIG